MEDGLLLVVSGPAGVGKGNVCQALCRRNPNLYYSVSCTTRPPRQGEQDGVNYHFVSEQKFKEYLQQGSFLEWAYVHDHYYGTPVHMVRQMLRAGRDVILEIDTQGAEQVHRNVDDGVFIFLLPPTMPDLIRRIKNRGTETPEEIRKRFARAYRELGEIEIYDYLVINEILEVAVSTVEAIIVAEKCRTHRRRGFVQQLLEKGDKFDLSLD